MIWANVCSVIVAVFGIVYLVEGIPKKSVPLIALGAGLLTLAIFALTNWFGK